MGQKVTIPVAVEGEVIDRENGDAVVAVDVSGEVRLPTALGDDDEVLVPVEPQPLNDDVDDSEVQRLQEATTSD